MAKRVLILGGGYGGLLSALSARKYLSDEEASITIVNRFSSHQIITELHRLAAGNKAEKAILGAYSGVHNQEIKIFDNILNIDMHSESQCDSSKFPYRHLSITPEIEELYQIYYWLQIEISSSDFIELVEKLLFSNFCSPYSSHDNMRTRISRLSFKVQIYD